MTDKDTPWVPLEDVCHMYGVKFSTAKNKVQTDDFPVPTYKVGKIIVIDREVHAEYFARHREAGLQALKTTKS